MPGHLDLAVEHSDITSFQTDVIVLKYAQAFHGADRMVAERLVSLGIPLNTLQPSSGDYCCASTHGCVSAPHALFIGVAPLYELNYPDIRAFGGRVLEVLATVGPSVRHIAMTIHGPGFGLDELEAFLAQVEGLLDAVRSGRLPTALERITIVDRNSERVARLRGALAQRLERARFATRVLGNTGDVYRIDVGMAQGVEGGTGDAATFAGQLEAGATERAHAFVAMSFSTQLDDVFYYGIQRPVHAAGMLCERMDKVAYTGEVMERIKQKIETAAVVIAELTGNNPNVYLEVGYAWGRGRPTILLAPNMDDLPFDVRGHRCLVYEGIRNLESLLQRELQELQTRKLI
jgi:hypothetical protein